MYHLATASVCVLDAYWPAISLLHHKKSLTVIQMWHALGKIKPVSYTHLDVYKRQTKERAIEEAKVRAYKPDGTLCTAAEIQVDGLTELLSQTKPGHYQNALWFSIGSGDNLAKIAVEDVYKRQPVFSAMTAMGIPACFKFLAISRFSCAAPSTSPSLRPFLRPMASPRCV